mmetsp:Transcript_21267/g.44670  ORF Transcript_21267/g.44670 Transcript_21267/m.44670 type:complete len:393 (+) Transcript_21267:2-1180(+)
MSKYSTKESDLIATHESIYMQWKTSNEISGMTLTVLESLESRFEDLKCLCVSLRSDVSKLKTVQDTCMSADSRQQRIKKLRYSRKLQELRWAHLPEGALMRAEGALMRAWSIWTQSIVRRHRAVVDASADEEPTDNCDASKQMIRRLSLMSVEANCNKKRSIGDEALEELSKVMRQQKLQRNQLMARKEERTVYSYATEPLIRPAGITQLKGHVLRIIFGIQPRNDAKGILGSKLIYPFSPFHVGVEIVCGFLLLYSAFIVPIQLSFWNSSDPCSLNPTLIFDMFTDLFFLLDVIYRFFVGIMKSDGTYCDNQKAVALINLASFWLFWFNLITSIPISWMEWFVLQQYCSETSTENTADSANLVGSFGVLRIVKPLRLFKLLRILRISKSFK